MLRTCAETDRFHEECGVFGVYGHQDAAALTALGLHALQHRGQEAAGIVSYDGEPVQRASRPRSGQRQFRLEGVIARLPGATAIGHVRYATTGETRCATSSRFSPISSSAGSRSATTAI